MTSAGTAPVHLFGSNVPIHSSSYGKLFLAYLNQNDRDRIIKTLRFEKYTSSTISDLKAFKNHLKRIRRQGYAIDDSETRKQLNGLAAPIFNADGHIAAAIAITAYRSKLNTANDPELTQYLLDKTLFISRQLGYQ